MYALFSHFAIAFKTDDAHKERKSTATIKGKK